MTSKSRPSFKALLDTAHEFADASGEAIRPYFRKPVAVSNKADHGGFDPVTAADQAAEHAIARALAARWPDHGIVGEEFGSERDGSRFRWVIDPIDGTRSFIMGSPLWGTLIGLLDGEDPVLGLMDQPFTRERFWSAQSASYYRQADGSSRRIKTRACPKLASATLATTHPDLFARGRERQSFAKVSSAARMTRFGGDCYSYCLLAAGFVDVIVEAGLNSYDIVALIPIIERAGGRVTTWDGKPATSGGRIVAVGDPALHDEVLRLLSR